MPTAIRASARTTRSSAIISFTSPKGSCSSSRKPTGRTPTRGLHTQGTTQEQSKKLFTDECSKDEGNAEQQAARGTYDPQYLNYTLNKLLIMKLRDDWTASRGGRKVWKQFHDTFLSYGGPQVPLVRQAMVREATPKTVF